MRKPRQSKLRLLLTVIMAGLCAVPIAAQTTAFTYQGKLTDAGNPANGAYDMQFKLFDTAAVGTGTEQGATITNPTVQVTNGFFAVNLDFGINVFTGAARFLEIGVRPAGNTNPYTVLTPRQQITSSPYAIQTINAQQFGGLPPSRFVQFDTNGNVGIGSITPNTRLTLGGGPIWTSNGWTASMNMLNGSAFGWEANASGQRFGIGQSGGGLYFFRTNSAFGNTDSLANYDMTITDTGNVGIGTTTPIAKLRVSGSGALNALGAPRFDLFNTAAGTGFSQHVTNGAVWQIATTFGATRMVIDPIGNVGIGTTSPTAKLTVSGAGAANAPGAPRFDLFNTTAGSGFLQHVTDSGLWQIASTSGATRMVVDPAGNVGIGTISPTSKVEIVAQDGLKITGFQPFMTLLDTNTGLRSLVAGGNGDLGFYPASFIGGVPAVLIQNGLGNVGIGTSSPVNKLQVESGGYNAILGRTNGAGAGVQGISNGAGTVGIKGESDNIGVYGSSGFIGVQGITTGDPNGQGIRGSNGGSNTVGYAGVFNGRVLIIGNLSKGGGSFQIDHPLDPENKYLYHSFVESPDMMNIYNGNITTDENGEATVKLPDYFEALNKDFRYQLTVIGEFAQAIIASKIRHNRFTIKTDKPHVEVSWQVTGIRHDAYANAHRIPVEQEKAKNEAGYYLHPQVFGQPEEKGVEWARQPELMRKMKEPREQAQQKPPQQQ